MSNKRRSQVFRHFDMPESCDESGNFRARCRHCSQHIGASNRASSNLLRHLQRKHAGAIHTEVAIVSTSTIEQPEHTELAEYPVKLEQQPIINFVQDTSNYYSPPDARQMEITDALITFIAGDSIPLSTVESPHFHGLLNALDPHYQIPSKYDLRYLCGEKSEELEFDICRRLQQPQTVCVTVNLWTNRSKMKSIIGITGHYFVDWTLQSVVLACKQVQGCPTPDSVLHHYEKTMACFALTSKITSIVTDNEKNMRTVFNLPWFDSIDNGTTEDDPESDTDVAVDSSAESLAEFDYGNAYEFLPAHQPCFAHELELVLKVGFQETTLIHKVLSKAADIVKSARKSALQMLQAKNTSQTLNATKWKSQLALIRAILGLGQEELDQLDANRLAVYERNQLEHLVEILSFFEQAADFVRAENGVTASYILPCARGIRIGLQKLSSGYNGQLVKALQAAVKERLSSYESLLTYRLAASLDPRFKLDWCSVDEYTEMKRDLLIQASSCATQSPNGANVYNGKAPPKKKKVPTATLR